MPSPRVFKPKPKAARIIGDGESDVINQTKGAFPRSIRAQHSCTNPDSLLQCSVESGQGRIMAERQGLIDPAAIKSALYAAYGLSEENMPESSVLSDISERIRAQFMHKPEP